MKNHIQFQLVWAALAVASAATTTSGDYYLESNLSNWLITAGAPATQANLFNYLPLDFPTQEIPGSIFADLGLHLSSSAPLIADHFVPVGTWWINAASPGASVELRFDTPQSAIYLNSGALLPSGDFVTFAASTKSYYAGDTLIASTTSSGIGIVSTVAIDRVVVTVNNPANRVYIGSALYFVPGPGALGAFLLAPALGRRRRRRS